MKLTLQWHLPVRAPLQGCRSLRRRFHIRHSRASPGADSPRDWLEIAVQYVHLPLALTRPARTTDSCLISLAQRFV